ncbi:hypothetical protein E1A91_D03G022800v1 [Gossypium mustelinum]|uniref:Uncharacterized protein n=1 Tax=Gossypium mustelinum TaxID=34275 RepID=A0A5D2VHW9_GOSMU|nr:hypothetical protein E1A91_D03G022800v1 [Gossypium mustelinum]
MYTSSHGNPKHAPAGHPTAPMNLPPPSHVSPFRGSAASASSWSTSLCHCCDDPANCLITAFCPCVTFGQIAEIVNKGSIYCADCLVHFFRETCSLCQEYRELKNRGFDMGIGWQANMDRQGRGITVAPVVGRMAR